jgi:hypothetical protein
LEADKGLEKKDEKPWIPDSAVLEYKEEKKAAKVPER